MEQKGDCDMEMIVIMLIVYVLGMVIGYEWGSKRKIKDVAPAPITYELGYDPDNPINGRGHRGEVVEICGKPFVRMN